MYPLNEHEKFSGVGKNFSGEVFRPSLSSRFICPIDKRKWLSITSSALLIITFALGFLSSDAFGKHNLNVDYLAKFALTTSCIVVAFDFSLFFVGQISTSDRLKSLSSIVANITIIALAILALNRHLSLNQFGITIMTVSSFALLCSISRECLSSQCTATHPPTQLLHQREHFGNLSMHDWEVLENLFSLP